MTAPGGRLPGHTPTLPPMIALKLRTRRRPRNSNAPATAPDPTNPVVAQLTTTSAKTDRGEASDQTEMTGEKSELVE